MKHFFQIFFIAVLLLCVSASHSKVAEQKFPYSGTWVGYEGEWRTRLTLSFSKAGICTFRVKVRNSQEKTLKVLSCKIVGDSAITEMKVQSGAVLVSKISPLSGGNKIKLQLLHVFTKDEKTGKINKIKQTRAPTILLRQKH
jgi:hypothetical protein